VDEGKYYLECMGCGGKFKDIENPCPLCGSQLFVRYTEVKLDIRDTPSMWRYIDLLPIDTDSSIVSLGEGYTPLMRAERISKILGTQELYLKDETRNPTGSFIDRGVSVEISRIQRRYKRIVCATLGDTGASLSAYAAKAGIKPIIYAPEKINIGKLYQMLLCGAEVLITKNYEEALMLAKTHKTNEKVFSEYSPYYLEGIKTIAYEVMEQLNWKTPDFVVVPMGTGGLITMIWKGVRELLELGLIEDTPGLIGVQIEGADPIVRAFRGEETDFLRGKTIAIDLMVRRPMLQRFAISAIRESNGIAISVEDDVIPRYIKMLAEGEGIIAEPSAIVPLIALKKLLDLGDILPSESVIIIITGSGLKTIDSLQEIVPIEDISLRLMGIPEKTTIRKIGETKLMILNLLSEGMMHGYEIRKKLREKYGISLALSTIYQHLHELMNYGLISRVGRKTKNKTKYCYFLTRSGRKLIEKHES